MNSIKQIEDTYHSDREADKGGLRCQALSLVWAAISEDIYLVKLIMNCTFIRQRSINGNSVQLEI